MPRQGRCAAYLAAALILAAAPAQGYAPQDDEVEEAAPPAPATTDVEPPGATTGEKAPRAPIKPEGDAAGDDLLPLADDPGADDLQADDPEGEGPYEDPHGDDNGMEQLATPAPGATIADVHYGADELPAPVAQTRALLLAAARTGEIEALRDVFARQRGAPVVAPDVVDDPVDHLRRQSGDAEGREILAILMELLEGGHVKVGGKGAAGDGIYVWPYFAAVPLEALEARHYVELYRVLTAIDVEEIERIGRYTFFRVGIASDGRLRYFTAGDME